jgi:hypothetical protein
MPGKKVATHLSDENLEAFLQMTGKGIPKAGVQTTDLLCRCPHQMTTPLSIHFSATDC